MGDAFEKICARTQCTPARRRTLEAAIDLSVEIAREGREGRKIGTMLVVGDVENVLQHSRPLLLDPLYGHPPDLLQIDSPEFRETVKELAQLDGAFVVADDGTFVAAARFLDVELGAPGIFLSGLGTRHAAGASISRRTDAVAIVVSQSAIVRVFTAGELRAEIIPELFLMKRASFLTPRPEIEPHPETGITVAVAGEA